MALVPAVLVPAVLLPAVLLPAVLLSAVLLSAVHRPPVLSMLLMLLRLLERLPVLAIAVSRGSEELGLHAGLVRIIHALLRRHAPGVRVPSWGPVAVAPRRLVPISCAGVPIAWVLLNVLLSPIARLEPGRPRGAELRTMQRLLLEGWRGMLCGGVPLGHVSTVSRTTLRGDGWTNPRRRRRRRHSARAAGSRAHSSTGGHRPASHTLPGCSHATH